MYKESNANKMIRTAERIELMSTWAKLIRSRIKLPQKLTTTMFAIVDAKKYGCLRVHIYKYGQQEGALLMPSAQELLKNRKFWMTAAPIEGDADGQPELRLLTKNQRKNSVCVYAGNHYLSIKIPLIDLPGRKELSRLFS